ncbi:MAG: hypothetical protein ACI9CE_001453 [Flavobacterium sp.]|jgi:hypothetical protein
MYTRMTVSLLIKIIGLILLSFGQQAFSAENREEIDWDRWAIHNPDSRDQIQYGPYNTLLSTVIDNSGDVPTMRYLLLKTPKLRLYLDSFFQYLQEMPVSKLNRNEQYAYWLNLYNLGLIELLVVKNGLRGKLKKARGLPGSPGRLWAETRFTVEGQALSLEDVEQKIIFKQWPDPYSLYGLSWGVKGSPAMSKIAFTGKNVHARLKLMGKNYLRKDGILNIKKDKVTLSSLYLWNKASLFQNSDKEIFLHLQDLVSANRARSLSRQQNVDRDKFNWRSVELIPKRATGSQALTGGR